MQPLWRPARINSLATITFDTTDALFNNTATQLSTNALTLLAVVKPATSGGSIVYQGFNFSGAEYGWAFGRGEGHGTMEAVPSAVLFGSSDNTGNYNAAMLGHTAEGTSPASTTQVIGVIKNGTQLSFWKNGELIGSAQIQKSPITYTAGNKLNIGSSVALWLNTGLDGELGELIGVKTNLSDNEMQSLSLYAINKWGA